MISYTEAQDIIRQQAHSFGTDILPLEKADGRVLVGKIYADRDYPPFNRATMDGYALRWEDLDHGIHHFRILEAIYAGDASTRPIQTGECFKIMTGAAVPPSADVVIRREDTVEGEGQVALHAANVPRYLNIARQGEDLSEGGMIIGRPCICEPAVIGVLASLGQQELAVARLPTVALITTGNEVISIDSPPGPMQIRNSNRWLLQSFLKKWQVQPSFYTHVADDKAALEAALKKALECDVVIMSGGVSAGDRDYVPEILQAMGIRCLFHKLSIKPGKPAWCGAGENTMVFALPGNPFSCLVGFTLLIKPYLEACFGLPAADPLSLPLGIDKNKHTNLDEFFPVRIQGVPAHLQPVSLNGSGDIRLAMEAHALALHPAKDGNLAAMTPVPCFYI